MTNPKDPRSELEEKIHFILDDAVDYAHDIERISTPLKIGELTFEEQIMQAVDSYVGERFNALYEQRYIIAVDETTSVAVVNANTIKQAIITLKAERKDGV